jgi:hypothetical protein
MQVTADLQRAAARGVELDDQQRTVRVEQRKLDAQRAEVQEGVI